MIVPPFLWLVLEQVNISHDVCICFNLFTGNVISKFGMFRRYFEGGDLKGDVAGLIMWPYPACRIRNCAIMSLIPLSVEEYYFYL